MRRYAEIAADAAPAAAASIAESLGLPAASRGTIALIGPETTDEEIRQSAAGIPAWAAGITLPSSATILIRLDRLGGYGQRQLLSVLDHELVHLTVAQGLEGRDARLPPWLAEGIASSLAHEGEWRDLWIVWTSPLASSSRPFADLDAALARGEDSKSLAYAGSLAAVGFLRERYGAGLVPGLLAGMRSGRDFDAAFAAASGVSVRSAEAAWAHELNLPWIWLVRVGSSYTIWMVATLLVLVAYLVKRYRSRKTLDRWSDDEGPPPPRDPGPADPFGGWGGDETVH
ncbi:MAG: hypothetical protein HY049_18565 [Acidobacteria bacterium]|nr:hypothetical protein [Acidobacteriota bacterium]